MQNAYIWVQFPDRQFQEFDLGHDKADDPEYWFDYTPPTKVFIIGGFSDQNGTVQAIKDACIFKDHIPAFFHSDPVFGVVKGIAELSKRAVYMDEDNYKRF